MNGPQRTACLAKGCINNQYQLTIPRQWARPMVTSLVIKTTCNFGGKRTDEQDDNNKSNVSAYIRHYGANLGPPEIGGGACQKKTVTCGTTREHFQTIYGWTALCFHL